MTNICVLQVPKQELPWLNLLYPCCKQPLIKLCIERLQNISKIQQLIVLLSQQSCDDELADLLSTSNIDFLRGNVGDSVSLVHKAATLYQAKTVTYLTAHQLIPDPIAIDKIITHFMHTSAHFCSNRSSVFGNGYPIGIGAEVFAIESLDWIIKNINKSILRSKIHLNFFNYHTQCPTHPEKFLVSTTSEPSSLCYSGLNLMVQTPQDLDHVINIYEALYPNNNRFTSEDIISWQAQHALQTKHKPTKTYCFALDGVICTRTNNNNYWNVEPNIAVIEAIQSLYSRGNTIIVQCNRQKQPGINWCELTKTQLRNWQLPYHNLLFNQPNADVYINNNSITINDWLSQEAIIPISTLE